MLLTLDFSSDVPIYLQIRNAIVKAIADGKLKEGERLPTVRALAEEAGINTMTVNKAYQLLKQEGFIIADRRKGATVQCKGLKKEAVRELLIKDLQLAVAEAKTGGISRAEFLEICQTLYGR